jgi:predicted permease
LRSGRLFTAADREGAAPVAIIDENLAREYWPGEDPLGKALRNDDNGPWYVIVGVVGNIHHTDLASESGKGTYYFSIYQQPFPFITLMVKTAGDPSAMPGVIREAVRSVDPTQPVHSVKTMSDWVEKSLAPRRFIQRLLVFFAAMALFLAAIGLYGVISYSVSQRTQEIGIRMALGANQGNVLGMVVGQGLRLAVAGAVIGLVGSIAAFVLLRSVLYRADTFDLITFASTCAVLLAAAALASYIPALRATRVSPTQALRYE